MDRFDSTPVMSSFLPARNPMEALGSEVGQNCRMRVLSFLLAMLLCGPALAAPGYAVWGEFRYPPGFDHFAYVNPQAPKGGELRLTPSVRTSNFDKLNPYILKGQEPPYE